MNYSTVDAGRHRLPRSQRSPGGLMTAWLGAWLSGRVSSDDLLTAVQGDDEPHSVMGLVGDETPVPLARLLTEVRGCAPATVQLRLPVAGDPDGLDPSVLAEALSVGEAVVVEPLDPARDALVLIPVPDVRGSAIEPLVTVTWKVRRPARRAAAGPSAPNRLREAELALNDAVGGAVSVLLDLGQVGRLSPEVSAAIAALRDRRGSSLGLPPGCPGDAVRVLVTAERLAAVVQLAAGEQGHSAASDARRNTALRDVATAVRYARRLAYTACATDDHLHR